MKYFFELNHPKHYYQFKYIMRNLHDAGHDVVVLARDKDVLLKVLKEENVPFLIFGKHKKNVVAKVLETFHILFLYSKIIYREKPDVIISKASFYGTFLAKLYHKKSIIFPDSEVVYVTNHFVVPFCTKVVTPETFKLDFGKKHSRVPGFFESCYLSKDVFTPNEDVVQQFNLIKPYAIIRFVGWNANHDVNNNGFTLEQKIKLVQKIEHNINVYISSEKVLPVELQKYQLKTPASLIHSVLYNADLYVGDSQTMATEAALLGTPSIRSNSFVGPNDMTNFIVLEKKYNLLKNIPQNNYQELMLLVNDYSTNSRKDIWRNRLSDYNKTVGDLNQFLTKLILSI